MKKFLIILFLAFFILVGCAPLDFLSPQGKQERIGLIPLDSRPANTQYPELLAKLAGLDLEIPYEYLDDFLTPANRDQLWQWLSNETTEFNSLIINTSVLFNGSLIETRNPEAYKLAEEQLEQFRSFCLENKDKNIIVINVLPRLLPSQFTNLWPYQKPLVEYAIALDKADLSGQGDISLPSDVPEELVQDYLSIYTRAELIAHSLIEMAQEGLIDHLLFGQDDAEKHGLSNRIVRKISKDFTEKITFVHGADELTMLALVKNAISVPEQGINISYSNKDFTTKVFPFEADTLEKVLEAKLNYLGLKNNPHSPFLEIIHTDPNNSTEVLTLIEENHHDYLGVADIAFTNRGDISLRESFLAPQVFNRINGYSGWNTASNTLGTELSNFATVQHFLSQDWKKAEKIKALEAYMNFKYIRFAEDFVYQGILRNELNNRLLAKGLDPNNLGERKAEAETILKELFVPYQEQLQKAFMGEHTLGDLIFTVKEIKSEISLPWARTFEAKIVPEVKVKL